MRSIVIAACLLITLGCSSHPTQLTQITPENLSQYEYTTLPETRAGAAGFALFGIIPISYTHREERARSKILELSGADDIINPSISSSYFITPVGVVSRITITATPIIIEKKHGSR